MYDKFAKKSALHYSCPWIVKAMVYACLPAVVLLWRSFSSQPRANSIRNGPATSRAHQSNPRFCIRTSKGPFFTRKHYKRPVHYDVLVPFCLLSRQCRELAQPLLHEDVVLLDQVGMDSWLERRKKGLPVRRLAMHNVPQTLALKVLLEQDMKLDFLAMKLVGLKRNESDLMLCQGVKNIHTLVLDSYFQLPRKADRVHDIPVVTFPLSLTSLSAPPNTTMSTILNRITPFTPITSLDLSLADRGLLFSSETLLCRLAPNLVSLALPSSEPMVETAGASRIAIKVLSSCSEKLRDLSLGASLGPTLTRIPSSVEYLRLTVLPLGFDYDAFHQCLVTLQRLKYLDFTFGLMREPSLETVELLIKRGVEPRIAGVPFDVRQLAPFRP
ncbi:hypothetical protein T439DRAFT_367187 [Meredithblackwellia eburnea MCA 4105]